MCITECDDMYRPGKRTDAQWTDAQGGRTDAQLTQTRRRTVAQVREDMLYCVSS
jgi:hypothetical protein